MEESSRTLTTSNSSCLQTPTLSRARSRFACLLTPPAESSRQQIGAKSPPSLRNPRHETSAFARLSTKSYKAIYSDKNEHVTTSDHNHTPTFSPSRRCHARSADARIPPAAIL